MVPETVRQGGAEAAAPCWINGDAGQRAHWRDEQPADGAALVNGGHLEQYGRQGGVV